MAKLCNNEPNITYYYICCFHYNFIITYYYHYYLLLPIWDRATCRWAAITVSYGEIRWVTSLWEFPKLTGKSKGFSCKFWKVISLSEFPWDWLVMMPRYYLKIPWVTSPSEFPKLTGKSHGWHHCRNFPETGWWWCRGITSLLRHYYKWHYYKFIITQFCHLW